MIQYATGIVLAGGKSSRMGTDKSLIDFNGKKMIEYALSVLTPISDELIISSNSDDHSIFNYKIVADMFSDCGPIGGIHAALHESKTEKNFVLSCDMPHINTSLFQYLEKFPITYDAVIPVWGIDKIQPLAGIFYKSIMPLLEENIEKGNYKMRDLLLKANTCYVPIDDKLPFYYPDIFKNINSPEDL